MRRLLEVLAPLLLAVSGRQQLLAALSRLAAGLASRQLALANQQQQVDLGSQQHLPAALANQQQQVGLGSQHRLAAALANRQQAAGLGSKQRLPAALANQQEAALGSHQQLPLRLVSRQRSRQPPRALTRLQRPALAALAARSGQPRSASRCLVTTSPAAPALAVRHLGSRQGPPEAAHLGSLPATAHPSAAVAAAQRQNRQQALACLFLLLLLHHLVPLHQRLVPCPL